MDQDQRTSVAAMAPSATKPRRGQVIGERYEVRGKLRNDAFTRGFLAFDQEHEQSVLLRVIRAELLDPMVREDVARRLREVTGIGGSYLPGILDGNLDGPFVYATEPVPEGASMRDVLDRRIAKKRPLEPFELLPVVAHLEAALRALPEGMRHGDVRAENVWTDSERLQLTGGFLLTAMPGGAVAAVVQRNTGLKRRFAREISIGGGMRSSDYFGVAALVYESLVLKAPQPDGRCDAVDPEIRHVLEPLMTPVPTERPTSLTDLIEVLARLAGLPVPELEPAPFKTTPLQSQQHTSDEEETVHDVETTIAPQAQRRRTPAKTNVDARPVEVSTEDDGLPPAPNVNEDDKTQPRASIHQIKDDGLRKRAEEAARAGAAERAKRRALTEAERRTRALAAGLDPRLVRAALADNEEGSHHIGAVDTRAGAPAASATPPKVKAESAASEAAAEPFVESEPPASHDPLVSPELTGLATNSNDESGEFNPEFDPDDPFEQGLRTALGDASGNEHTSEGVPMDPSVPVGAELEGTQEIGLDELEEHRERLSGESAEVTADADFPESEEVVLDPSVPAKPAKGGTQEISFDELHDMERAAGGGDPAPAVLLSDLSGMKREMPPARDVALMDSADASRAEPAISPPVLSADAFSSAPTAPPAQPPQNAPSAHAPAAALPMLGSPVSPGQATPAQIPIQEPVTHAKTSPGAPKMRRAPAKTIQMRTPRKRGSDQWIIIGALLLGAMIIAGGLLYARHSREEKLQQQQERLQQRYEQTAAETRETSP
ncbi:MAG: hypothetical protein ACI9KE_003774 [Polyangiales bacterium]|jgi:hypothetical protein